MGGQQTMDGRDCVYLHCEYSSPSDSNVMEKLSDIDTSMKNLNGKLNKMVKKN